MTGSARPSVAGGVALAALLLMVLGTVLPAPAEGARKSRKKAIWGPVSVDGVSQFDHYRRLGAGIYMARINWNEAAPERPARMRDPGDPAYRWPAWVDEAVREAARHRIRVAIVLTGSPGWANGGRDERWAPREPRHFARFAVAAARRYPGVRLWQIWAEPTQRANFKPLRHERRDKPLTRKMRRGPRLYARILHASHRALKRESRRNKVIGGNTFVTGDVSPRNWIRNLRLPNGKPPRMDMYGHNPFSARRPILGRTPLGHGFADFSDLPILVRWVDRHLGRPRGRRSMKIFISEMLWPTDHENFEFNFWVTRETAASWLSDALRTTRRWKRIYTLAWSALYDDPVRPDGLQVERGLLTRSGEEKPAYHAYRRG